MQFTYAMPDWLLHITQRHVKHLRMLQVVVMIHSGCRGLGFLGGTAMLMASVLSPR